MNKTIKVLLADTSDFFGVPCAAALRSHELDVIQVEKDGRKLLERIEAEKPEAVVLDFFLSGLDAVAVISQTKKLGIPQPCFLVMSNTDNPVIEQSALEAGAAYYFLKPFDPHLMAERIQTITGERRHPLYALARPTPPEGGSLAMQVTEIFRQIGIPASLDGYNYLRTAILMAIEDESLVRAITKRLYPAVARKHGSTSSRVERAMRHAIESAWDRGDVEVLNAYFGYTIHNGRGKPTNSEFIAMISDKFRLRLKIG